MGFGFDFGAALNRKYDILGQHANAAQTTADAAASNAVAQNRRVGIEGQQVAQTGEYQKGLLGIEAEKADTQRDYEGALGGAATRQSLQQQNTYDENSRLAPYNPFGDPFGATNVTTPSSLGVGAPGFAHGTADVPMTHEQRMALHGQLMAAKGANRVPGRVDPQTVGTHASDTVPAMLAPGEAVLNKHAAELMGRDKIAALNAVGEAHGKGMVGQAAPGGKPQRVTPVTRPGFAGGSQNVSADPLSYLPENNSDNLAQTYLAQLATVQPGQYNDGADATLTHVTARARAAAIASAAPSYIAPSANKGGWAPPAGSWASANGGWVSGGGGGPLTDSPAWSRPDGVHGQYGTAAQTADVPLPPGVAPSARQLVPGGPSNEAYGWKVLPNPDGSGGIDMNGGQTHSNAYLAAERAAANRGIWTVNPTRATDNGPAAALDDWNYFGGDRALAAQHNQIPTYDYYHREEDAGRPSPGGRYTGYRPLYSKGTANVPKPQKLAGGTHMVGHGKSAKTPKKLDPQAVVQLMGMLKGGQPGMGAAPQMAPQGAPQMAPPQGGMA